MKKSKILIVALIIILIGIFILIMTNVKQIEEYIYEKTIQYNENAIDKETGIINNKYFEINSNGEEPIKTYKGINRAIVYANKFNIEYIKLEKGFYLIEEDCIRLKSNIHLDLNGSTIKYNTNNKEQYSTLKVLNCENVKISNGKLIGDKDTHQYIGNSTHEWGMGIDIISSVNVEIIDLEIENYPGDGIQIWRYNETIPQEIKISNCNIHDCRRQGISIICGNQIEIYNNEIYNILGTGPQACIDIETDNTKNIIDNVKIYRNKLNTEDRRTALLLHRGGKNIEIYENEMQGGFVTNEILGNLQICNNVVKNGDITFELNEWMIQNGYKINAVELNNNIIINGKIETNNLPNIILRKN